MSDVIAFDWSRLLFGDAPALFYLEILFRVAVIWVWSMALLRWIGGRSIAQLSLVEFLFVISLGSAVGDSLFYPSVPLLHAMFVVLILVLLDKGVDTLVRRSNLARSAIEGGPCELVREGVILHHHGKTRILGSAEVMEILRIKGIENLGSLRHAYLEAGGQVSLFRYETPRLGLAIVPPLELVPPVPPRADAPKCCTTCGQISQNAICENCGGQHWTTASAEKTRPLFQDGRV